MGQSCAHARIEWGNPVPTPGLTAGRVNGGPLPDLRRWPGDGFFGQNTKVGNPTSLKDRSWKSDLGLYRSRISNLGAGSAGLGCRAGGAAGGALGVEPLGEPSTRLGEPVLIGRARTHWANPYWASHQTRLGRAIKRGWASQY